MFAVLCLRMKANTRRPSISLAKEIYANIAPRLGSLSKLSHRFKSKGTSEVRLTVGPTSPPHAGTSSHHYAGAKSWLALYKASCPRSCSMFSPRRGLLYQWRRQEIRSETRPALQLSQSTKAPIILESAFANPCAQMPKRYTLLILQRSMRG